METATLIGLGALLVGWAFNAGKRKGSKKGYFVAFRSAFPENALTLTALVGVPQAALAVALFFKCKCGEEKCGPPAN